MVRYRKLAKQAAAWHGTCVALAVEMSSDSPGLLRRMLTAMTQHPTRAYSGRRWTYGHIRICRLFMYAVDIDTTDTVEDWPVCRRWSPHVSKAFRDFNIHTYDDALAARDFLREVIGMPEYSFSDLTAYLCLATSHRH